MLGFPPTMNVQIDLERQPKSGKKKEEHKQLEWKVLIQRIQLNFFQLSMS